MRYGDKKPKIIRSIIFCVFIILAVFIQNTAWHLPVPDAARVLAVIPLSVCISMFEREIASALFGAFAGVLWDISSGVDGFNALVIMILCAVCSLLVSRIMRNNIVTSLVLCAGAAFCYELLYIPVFILSANGGAPFGALICFYLPSLASTVIATVPIYYAVRAISVKYKTDE